MINQFNLALKQFGVGFNVERNGSFIFKTMGIMTHENETNKQCINFPPDADIAIGDWVICPNENKYFIEDMKLSYFMKKPNKIRSYYLTEVEFKRKIDDSIKTIKERSVSLNLKDNAEFNLLIETLESIAKTNTTASSDIAEQFSSLMQKHSWMTGPMTSIILNWLLSIG